jgi:hypothetical protein
MKATILATIMLGLAFQYETNETIYGSGNVVQEMRDVSGFNSVPIVAVHMATMGNLNIWEGDEERLLITAEDNLIPYFVTEMVGEELVIRITNNVDLQPTQPVIFDLWVKDLMNLREVEVFGSGDIHAPNLSAEQFALVLAGSGTVEMLNLQPTVKVLTVLLAGSGNVVCSGEVDRQVINIAGSGYYEAAGLASGGNEIVINGSGNAVIHVVDGGELDAQIKGSGTLYYYGNPTQVRKSVSGSGTITPGY